MIIIENNGNEIPGEELEAIRQKLDVFDGNGTGMGLNNTHWRLKLKYGDKSGLKIENMEKGGVRVVLCIEPEKGEE